MAKLVSRCSPIEFLNHVFNRRSVEIGRSHDASVCHWKANV